MSPLLPPALKRPRLEAIAASTGTTFQLIEADLEDRAAFEAAFAQYKPQKFVNLAAQAGVSYTIDNPAAYIQSNLVGFGYILKGCRLYSVGHPVSLYAASKKANELMAHPFSRL